MSPIDFPDLLEGDRGRRKNSAASGGLVSTLRNRSRSRSTARAQRRAVSCQPTERQRSKETEKEKDKKKRRSVSRPSRSKSSSPKIKTSSKKEAEVVDISAKMVEKKKKRAASQAPEKKKRTASPSKRSALKKSNSERIKPKKDKEWGNDIINLVDAEEDEDFLLSEILSGKNPVIVTTSKKTDRKTLSSSSNHSKKDVSPSRKDKYAASTSAGGSPKSVGRFPAPSNTRKSPGYSDEELSESESESEEEEDAEDVDARALLDQVKSRMEQQRLLEEAKELRRVIEKKDAEIEQLTGQLRMAISTKCDLVIAHTELERLHEGDLKRRDEFAEHMKRSNLALVEMRAEIEKEFMNELTSLSTQVQQADEKRMQELEAKDQIIGLMEDKIRRMELAAMGGQSARRHDDDKVKFYKKRLGVLDQ